MAKTPVTPALKLPPMLPNEIASGNASAVRVRAEACRARWMINNLATADGHRLNAIFSCSVKAVDEAAERKMLAEVFLARKQSASVDDVLMHFEPSLRAAAGEFVGTQKIASGIELELKSQLSDHLRKAAERTAFSCGLEILAPFALEVDSPSFQQQKFEAMERNLAQQRMAGQVEHFEKAAALLKQFEKLKGASPDITPGAVLGQISPSEQGAMLQTLLIAAGKSATAKTLYAVAGPFLVKINPRVLPATTDLLNLPTDLGPLRSVQNATVESQDVLLIGARSGIMLIDPQNPTQPKIYADSSITSQLGFSSAVIQGHLLVGCHSEAGIVSWNLNDPSHPVASVRPSSISPALPGENNAASMPSAMPTVMPTIIPTGNPNTAVFTATYSTGQSIESPKPASPRYLTNLTDSRSVFSAGYKLFQVSDSAMVTHIPLKSTSPIVSIIADSRDTVLVRHLYIIREDGLLTVLDQSNFSMVSEQSIARGIVTAAALPWLGTLRLLIAPENGPIQCLGTDDQLVTQYCSNHHGIKILTATADVICAVSNDRNRLIVWNCWDGKKPAAEISIAASARHRVADVSFG